MSKISVIVPVYNVEKYIAKCLDSILAQTYENIEILCVNDGATDNSGKILDEYAARDSRVKVFHKENGGVSSARNLALENATGDYIAFVDSDDYIAPDMYESLLSALKENDADIAECSIAYAEEDGNIKYGDSKKYALDDQKAMLEAFFLKKIAVVIWNKLFKSKVLEGLTFDANYKIGEDSLFLYNALKNARSIVGIEKVGYYYLQRTTSVMHNVVDEKKLKLFEIVDFWLDESRGDKVLYDAAVKRDCVLSVFVLDSAIKNRKENAGVVEMLRRRVLRHRKTILNSKNFSLKFKMGVILLWICPSLYYKVKK